MKKEWNAPMMEELTIKATAGRGGHRPPQGNNWGNNWGGDNSDVCHCYNGTSPCQNHHDKYEDPEEKTS